MTEPVADRMPRRRVLETALYLALHRGVVPARELQEWVTARFAGDGGRSPWRRMVDVLAPLRAEGLVVRVGEAFYVPNLADLVAWAADGYEAREDGGHADDPQVPGQGG